MIEKYIKSFEQRKHIKKINIKHENKNLYCFMDIEDEIIYLILEDHINIYRIVKYINHDDGPDISVLFKFLKNEGFKKASIYNLGKEIEEIFHKFDEIVATSNEFRLKYLINGKIKN